MAGEIKHQWNGSVLTVTSDSGASSADLRGPKGDTGPRGPQGPAGVIYDEDGKVVVDLSPFYTKEEVDDKIEQHVPDMSNYATHADVRAAVEEADLEVDLTGYATEKYVDEQITNVATGGTIDLGNYYTKSEVDNAMANQQVAIDGLTIKQDADGKIKTAIGGYKQGGYIISASGLNVVFTTDSSSSYKFMGYFKDEILIGTTYYGKIVFSNGLVENFTFKFSKMNGTADVGYATTMPASGSNQIDYLNLDWHSTNPSSNYFSMHVTPVGYNGTLTMTEFYVWLTNPGSGYYPIDGNFIPVDGTSVFLNDEGKLAAAVSSEDFELTEEMKAEIVAAVIDAMPQYEGEVEDV